MLARKILMSDERPVPVGQQHTGLPGVDDGDIDVVFMHLLKYLS